MTNSYVLGIKSWFCAFSWTLIWYSFDTLVSFWGSLWDSFELLGFFLIVIWFSFLCPLCFFLSFCFDTHLFFDLAHICSYFCSNVVLFYFYLSYFHSFPSNPWSYRTFAFVVEVLYCRFLQLKFWDLNCNAPTSGSKFVERLEGYYWQQKGTGWA